MVDWAPILGVDPSASMGDVKRAYLQRMQDYVSDPFMKAQTEAAFQSAMQSLMGRMRGPVAQATPEPTRAPMIPVSNDDDEELVSEGNNLFFTRPQIEKTWSPDVEGYTRPRRLAQSREVMVDLTLDEIYCGVEKTVDVDIRWPCRACARPCTRCTPVGSGWIRAVKTSAATGIKRTVMEACPQCQTWGYIHGAAWASGGSAGTGPCNNCDGRFATTETRRYTVQVPAGVPDGERVRLEGWGEQTLCSDVVPGDVWLVLRTVCPSPLVSRRGPHIVVRLFIPFIKTVTGAEFEVALPSGLLRLHTRRDIGIVHTGRVYTLPGRGLPLARGKPLPAGKSQRRLPRPSQAGAEDNNSGYGDVLLYFDVLHEPLRSNIDEAQWRALEAVYRELIDLEAGASGISPE